MRFDVYQDLEHTQINGKRFFDFKSIDVELIEHFPNVIEDIQTRTLDGIVVKGFLSPNEISNILLNIISIPEELCSKVRTGHTFPVAYFEADENSRKGLSMDGQMTQWKKDRITFTDHFGIDLECRLKNIFKTFGGGRNALVVEDQTGQRSFIPFTVRVFYPEKGGIPVHCGNMFEQMLPNLYENLHQEIITKNQLSYFITIQNPDSGGGLRIYDLEWKPGQQVTSETDIKIDEDASVSFNEDGQVQSFVLPLEPGDLVIFAAGEIWHRVDSPKGKKNRITVGGFLGFTKDNENIAFWS